LKRIGSSVNSLKVSNNWSNSSHTLIAACADRQEGTWISKAVREAYLALHQLGFAHSVEAWQGDELVGGLYGVSLGGAFFGESMYYRVTDASKVALVELVERMKARGFSLLDVQFVTEHLGRMGAVEISRQDYERRLQSAIQKTCSFDDTYPATSFTEPWRFEQGVGGGQDES